MHDLNREFDVCKEILDELDIPYNKDVTISVNTRAKRRFGTCRYKYGYYAIDINADLLNERNSVDGLRNTILHELLHTCPGCMNHGEQWQEYGRQVYMAYGYNIKRTSTQEEKGITVFSEPTYKIRYDVKCTCCDNIWQYRRAGKVVKNPETFRCPCGGSLTVQKINL